MHLEQETIVPTLVTVATPGRLFILAFTAQYTSVAKVKLSLAVVNSKPKLQLALEQINTQFNPYLYSSRSCIFFCFRGFPCHKDRSSLKEISLEINGSDNCLRTLSLMPL